jgi:hypothetical protein
MTAAIVLLVCLQGPGEIDFPRDVLPHLTKAGCNSGQCHGAAPGQKGFKLSLLGFDPEWDHRAITRELRGRRVDLAQPEQSLILKKPSRELPHGGGKVLVKDSEGYRTVLAWIRAGAPYRSANPAEVVRIEAAPSKVTAWYSDGSSRDVTRLALMTSNDDAVADDDGSVKAAGETSIMVRYGGQVAAVKVGKPFGPPTRPPARRNLVDDPVNAKLSHYGLDAAAACDDATFLRRATLDAWGRIPTPDEARTFDGDRDRLVDSLVAAEDFAVYWSHLWAGALGAKTPEFRAFLRSRIATRYDDLVKALVSEEPHLYLAQNDPKALSESVGQMFLGSRWMCAQCHNHPFERFTRKDYYGMASYFARVRVRDGRVELEPRGELELDGKPVLPPFGSNPDRRADLARWIVENGAFARATVNRIWTILMGRGLVEPVDDLRASNPPTHPELLEALADEFRKDFSIPRLAGLIMKSAAYQRRSGKGDPFYASRRVKPLEAEVLADAIHLAAGIAAPRHVGSVRGADPLLRGETLARTLHLMNSEWIDRLLVPDTVENLYLRTLSRLPTSEERAHWPGTDDAYLKDLFWALLNSKEFGSNH